MVNTLQVNGSRGELTPLMHARVDTEFYQQAFAQCRNTVVTRYGPHTRVPGTLWQGDAKSGAAKSRMLPFEFSETQLYALEFGVGYVRFWTPEGQVTSGGSPYEIASPYTEADLQYLHGRQSGDALYLWCNGKRPQVLKRASETSWSFEPYVASDGPYMDVNTTSNTLTLSSTQSVIPYMTANNAPAPYVVSSTQGNSLVNVFNGSRAASTILSNGKSGFVQVDLGAGNAKVVDNYYLIAPEDNSTEDRMFSQWDFKGSNDDVNWVNLDSRDKERGWAGSEARYFTTDNKQAFRYYRLDFAGGGAFKDTAATSIGGWYMHEAPDTQPPSVLTALSTLGINGNNGFATSDVGRSVRIKAPFGGWRWARIVAYLNPLQVQVKVYGQALLRAEPVQAWAMGAWSETSGWPRTGKFFEDRLAQAGWASDPVGMALSVTGDYDNFRLSSPVVDDDAITLRMTGGRLDIIYWLTETGTLLAGTGGGLRSVGGRDSGAVLKHDNLRQRLETSTAASRVQPANVENVSLFIDRTMRRLYELGYDYQADGYQAGEVSVLNDHLFKRGIEQVDYVSAPYCTTLARRSDGKVVFFTYDRGQKIAGGTLCDFGGFVEDLMVMAGRTYPDVWMVIRRTVNGVLKRHIERLAPYWDGELDPDAPPVYAASARVYDGVGTGSLAGLSNLADEVVGIWADGTDIGDATVSSTGTLTLPYGKVAELIVVGKRMPWRLQSLRLPSAGAQDGSGLGRKMRIARARVDVLETARIYAGGLYGQELLRSEDYSEHDPDTAEPMLTCMLEVAVDDSFKNEGVFVIRGDSMYPATVRAVSLEVEGEP